MIHPHRKKPGLTTQILIAMGLGIILGLVLNYYSSVTVLQTYLVNGLLDAGGKIFIILLTMLVVPVVFVSLVCGIAQIGGEHKFAGIAVRTVILYLITTALAVTLALTIANIFNVGAGVTITPAQEFHKPAAMTVKETLLHAFPKNPFAAFAAGNLLQVIVFSILLGLAIAWSGEHGKRIIKVFHDFNIIIIKLLSMIIKIAPYGVFCLISSIFAQVGFSLITQLIGYFATVFVTLMIQLFIVYAFLLRFVGRLKVMTFYRKMFPAVAFAFSTATSTAAIPIVLNVTINKLGVKNYVSSFIVPLGATINMDGTVIMQGVATIFIANMYGIDLSTAQFLTIILTATLASIGTAGIPSAGLITLTLVLIQVGIPIEGIALILGVDRLLDMTRTAVNITGDATITCLVGKMTKSIDLEIYNNKDFNNNNNNDDEQDNELYNNTGNDPKFSNRT